MYVTYDQYTAMGYYAIPEYDFPRWALKAEQTVRSNTFDRITDENITELNRAGVCEIAETLYAVKRVLAVNEAGQIVSSYTNHKYAESYVTPAEAQAAFDRLMADILDIYFTPEQLYRGAA
jgi:hypothetical protein